MKNKKYLKNATIYRGGYGVRKRKETESCSLQFNTNTRSLDINFNIASKGGGNTYILLRIRDNDFPLIFEEIGKASLAYSQKIEEMRNEISKLKKQLSGSKLKNIVLRKTQQSKR